MKTILLLILLAISTNSLSAQAPLTFINVDTATYRAYLNSDWNRIIETGKQAIDKDIDYYYLRLRIAYALYMKKQYRMAIPHYKKALKYSNNDVTALEYLYYCYQYGGRKNDAEKLVSQFPYTLKNYFKKDDSKLITDIGFYFTFAAGSEAGLKNEIFQTVPDNIEGSQILLNSFKNYNINLSHRIGRSVIIHHSMNLLHKDEYALTIVNSTTYLSESLLIRQFNYHLGLDITPIEGLILTPTISYVNYRIPIFYDYGVGSSKNRQVYTYNTHHEAALGIKASKQFGIFNISLAGAHSNFNLSKQNTGAISIMIYPLGNLNLYFTANGYLHTQNQNTNTIQQVIQSHKLGFKIIKNLWMEGSVMFGGFTNLYDPFSELTYNSLEQYNTITGVNFIIPLHKSGISFFAGYRNYQSESMFVPVDNVFESSNNKIFNYKSITGGIIWKL